MMRKLICTEVSSINSVVRGVARENCRCDMAQQRNYRFRTVISNQVDDFRLESINLFKDFGTSVEQLMATSE